MRNSCFNVPILLSMLGWLAATPVMAQDDLNSTQAQPAVAVTNAPGAVLPEDPLPPSTNEVSQTATEANNTADEQQEQVPQRAPEIVLFRADALVKTNETANAVVVIGGSAHVHGKVHDAIVAIGGDIELTGEAESAVAIFGNINMSGDAKAREVVAILGNINGKGNAQASEAVSVGGRVSALENARFSGETVSLQIPGIAAPEWLHEWFRECVMKLRPFAPGIPWLWVIAAVVIGFYFLVGMVFRTPVRACRNVILDRPATSLMVGFLVKLLAPLVIFILAATGIGLIVVPFVLVGLTVMAVFGKAALVEAIGASLGRAFGTEILQKPAVAFLIGAVIVLALYMVPIVGLLVFLLLGAWAMGAAAMALSAGLRRERRPGAGGPVPRPQYAATTGAGADTGPAYHMANASVGGTASDPLSDPALSSTGIAPAGAEGLPPRYAGFWQRMGAAFLDIVLVSVVAAIAGGGKFWWLVAIAYFAGMWAWRGTTVGGVVLGLKIVRVDGRPLSFAASLIRAVTAIFSGLCLFLGFFWIGWDADKQGWHDKVAGTVVLKQDRSAPLVCL